MIASSVDALLPIRLQATDRLRDHADQLPYDFINVVLGQLALLSPSLWASEGRLHLRPSRLRERSDLRERLLLPTLGHQVLASPAAGKITLS